MYWTGKQWKCVYGREVPEKPWLAGREPALVAVACHFKWLYGRGSDGKTSGWRSEDLLGQKENLVYMTGPATTVFDGEIRLPEEIA